MLVSWCTQLKSHCLAGYASYRGQGNVRGTCVHPWAAGRRFTCWATAAGTLSCCGHRQLPAAQDTLLPFTSQAPEARGTASAEPPVLTFREIWNRSFCRPLEQLVDVITEFPNEVEYIFRPSCVSLQRCGGCCGDEGLRCVPVETSTVTMQLLKIKPNGEAPYVEMVFTEHKQCECRPRQDLMRLGRRRSKGRGKRKQDKKRRKDCELCGTPRR
ncbi:placenta growth factor isoform X2 [Columba livia]|uniref:placenta growth factor isoform X2 n=1 Tax=Columba livia TaxID=8932 RepID=UPI0031BB3DD4